MLIVGPELTLPWDSCRGSSSGSPCTESCQHNWSAMASMAWSCWSTKIVSTHQEMPGDDKIVRMTGNTSKQNKEAQSYFYPILFPLRLHLYQNIDKAIHYSASSSQALSTSKHRFSIRSVPLSLHFPHWSSIFNAAEHHTVPSPLFTERISG